ncbi:MULTISPECIES: hypothetical protein [unclassified Epibacterium]|uniref:hypothetical protein n=1 Tax=unclassified Epibacterium TaxID=2639179 RepID=UPI001EF58AC3|nr:MULTISPECIES: hypothetical protein [unclassified Epibacterium]MCG7622265.1 hypothetical protein [Epibacterium sp. Ofav1-8]MCG7626743.1 hypothetical protein [Epibacterium sp. MM17-32]
MSAIQPSDCTIFVQIWVDTDALVNGQTTGVYLVDNNLNHGSANEGSVNLMTAVPVGTNICWSLLNVDPTSDTILSIQNFGNAGVFGASGTPQQVNATTWTGTVQAQGEDRYAINFSAQIPGKSGITTSVDPTLSVH